MEMENKQIKALCDYLLGYWQLEVDEDDDDDQVFNEYFIDKYGVDLEQELNIGTDSWKGAHIELSNLLCENNSELSKLLLGMVFMSSSRNNENIERMNKLMEDLYKQN